MKMQESLNKQLQEMERVKQEMKHCGTPHRNDLYKYYQKLKKEYLTAIWYLKKEENANGRKTDVCKNNSAE